MSEFSERIARAREQLQQQEIDALLLSVGADLPYLTGFAAMATERLTMLVLPRDGEAKLVIAGLEAPLVQQHDDFDLVPWGETEDPLKIVNDMLGGASSSPSSNYLKR